MAGYISKNKADWLFQEIFCDEEYCGGSCYKCGKEAQYRNKLLQEPDANVQPVNQWVNIKDKVPDEDGWYIVYKFKQVRVAEWCENCWYNERDLPIDDCAITHWMPLLDPPTND